MNLAVAFHRAARAEFIAEIERCVDAVAERPTTYPAIYEDVRRVVANRFPQRVLSSGRTTNRRFGRVTRQARPLDLAAADVTTKAEMPGSVSAPNYRG
jgi:hypothetical protein